jgi:predicted oxidoreductase
LFGRGENAYNRYQGDVDHHPNACLAPLVRAPYYGVKILPGDLGTFAGLRTDACARVIDGDGNPLRGLYAIGNDMASVFRGNYPGPGANLGPALTFAYICAQHIASQRPDHS